MTANSGVPEILCHWTRVKTLGRSNESLSHKTGREGRRHQKHSVTEDRLLCRRLQKHTASIFLLGKINMVCGSKESKDNHLRLICLSFTLLSLAVFSSIKCRKVSAYKKNAQHRSQGLSLFSFHVCTESIWVAEHVHQCSNCFHKP